MIWVTVVMLFVFVAWLGYSIDKIEAGLDELRKEISNRDGPEDDIHYGIGVGWTYDREGSR